MQLNHEPPDYAYSLRAADGRSAKVNDQVLGSSFFLTPDQLVTHWPVVSAAAGGPGADPGAESGADRARHR
jgi:uncharacterized protein